MKGAMKFPRDWKSWSSRTQEKWAFKHITHKGVLTWGLHRNGSSIDFSCSVCPLGIQRGVTRQAVLDHINTPEHDENLILWRLGK